MENFLQVVINRFSMTTPSNVKGIDMKNLVESVQAPLQDVYEFRITFMLLALVYVLCPTISYRLCPKLIPAAIAASQPQSYGWCTLVLDQLMYAIKSFARRFYPMGYSKGCGGCTIFLSIMYLDRLKRTPMKWGVFPSNDSVDGN